MPFRAAPTLFLAQFAASAAFLAPVPVLPDLARDLGVSVATAGQLRTLSGIAAAVAALAAGRVARRIGVRGLLLAGLALIAVGAAVSALAPSFVILAAAQPALGTGIAAVMAGALSAAAAWAPPAERSRVLAWTVLGQPAAWVAGMPIIGAVAATNWRWAWVSLPLLGATVGLAAVARRHPDASAANLVERPVRIPWREPGVAPWALSELLTYSAWGTVLVYAGALFLRSYALSPGATGWLLSGAAACYFPGALVARRWAESHAHTMLVAMGLIAALGAPLFDTLRLAPAMSAAALGLLMATVGARSIAATAFDLHAAPARRAALMGARAAATQLGYLFGAGLGGLALGTGGYAALGALAGGLFALGVAPHLAPRGAQRSAAWPSPTAAVAPSSA